MAVDKVKPLKIEDATDGTEVDVMPTQTDPSEDYLACKGIAFENSDSYLLDVSSGDLQFTDTVNGTILLSTILSRTFITYSTVTNAESANGSDNDLCYVVETETWYRYEASGSAYTDDNTYVLSTGDGGNTRWLAISGKYNIKYKNSDRNTYDGWKALESITSGSGQYNTAYGDSSGSAINVGDYNSTFGFQSGTAITGGLRNSLFGTFSGAQLINTTGICAFGYGALNSNTAGLGNSSFGYFSSRYASGDYNTVSGYESFYGSSGLTDGSNNTTSGYRSGYAIQGGNNNSLFGSQAGVSLVGGSSNIVIGGSADVFSASDTNSVIIGANLTATASSQIRIGNSSVTTCFIEGIYGVTDGTDPYIRISSSGQLRQDSSSIRDKENVTNLSIDSSQIYNLQPKMYNRISSGKLEMGYIAEDVVQFMPEVVGLVEQSRVIEGGDPEVLVPSHINYDKIIIPLIEEIKALKARIEVLENGVN